MAYVALVAFVCMMLHTMLFFWNNHELPAFLAQKVRRDVMFGCDAMRCGVMRCDAMRCDVIRCVVV